MQLAFGFVIVAEIHILVFWIKILPMKWIAFVWLSAAAGCDIVITVAQVAYLLHHKPGVSKRTNHIINILMIYILSTGLLTSILAIIELTAIATLEFNFVPIFLNTILGPCYIISFLANLDARRYIRDSDRNYISMSGLRTSIHIEPDTAPGTNDVKNQILAGS
ncbi:hypothetical protein H2248_003472 [Termitomyces sp. 'cryptogamus']|nr:hypothetical protein H2248_003472 [Termitomyces sp. 'cryptogamus']